MMASNPNKSTNMNRLVKSSLVLVTAFLCFYVTSYSQKKLLVLGSSTSSCYWGPSRYDSCYLARLQRHYQQIGSPILLDNRAVAGDNPYHGMPTTYVPPAGRNAPRPESNITDGLKANPDIVLVNYPSNGYDYFTVDEVMFCLRTIKQTANNSGKPCYITTTQPRNDPESFRTPTVRRRMVEIRTRVLAEFGEFAINFWDDIVNPSDTSIQSIYNADGTHLNDRGHRVLFNKVLEKNIFGQAVPDITPPSAPSNLRVVSTSRNAVQLAWESSTDNVGVSGYEIYVNNVRQYTTSATGITVPNLSVNTSYTFTAKAVDQAGNTSGFSNSVSAVTASQGGLTYRYYEGSWSSLPDFNALSPVKTGVSDNIDLGVRNVNDGFGLLWEGLINIPVSGNYTFEIISDDGSRLYFNSLYSHQAVPLINNDGLHGDQASSATIPLTAGSYPIALAYFENRGLETMQLYWTGPGITRQLVPASAFSTASLSPGLNYRYYEGEWDQLPDFSALTPVKTGSSRNIDLNLKSRNDLFAFIWEGYLRIPASGNYTFELASDDGSKLYLNSSYSNNAQALIDNNYLHSDQARTATLYLAAGLYPFAVTYFEKTGLENLNLYWTGPGISRQSIPDAAFSRTAPVLPGSAVPQPLISGLISPSPQADNLARYDVASSITVYPNPFLNQLNLRFYNAKSSGKAALGLYDLSGKLLFSRNLGNLPAGYQTLDVLRNSHLRLTPGTYILKLYEDGALSKSWKIMKLKN